MPDPGAPRSADLAAALVATAPLNNPTGTVAVINNNLIGLCNVDNTSDAAKPMSIATQTALAAKAPISSLNFSGTFTGLSEAALGLRNVDNTSDAARPIPTAIKSVLA